MLLSLARPSASNRCEGISPAPHLRLADFLQGRPHWPLSPASNELFDIVQIHSRTRRCTAPCAWLTDDHKRE